MTGPHFPAEPLHRLALRHEQAVSSVPGCQRLTLRGPVWRPEDHVYAALVLAQAGEAYTALSDRYLNDTTELKSRIGQLLDALAKLEQDRAA